MKSAAHRDFVSAKVKETFAAFSSFKSLPAITAEPEDMTEQVKGNKEESDYVSALFEIINRSPDRTIIGREGDRIVSR